jgi:hypothetical protein
MDCTDADVAVRMMTWPSDSLTHGSMDERLTDDVAIGGRLQT